MTGGAVREEFAAGYPRVLAVTIDRSPVNAHAVARCA